MASPEVRYCHNCGGEQFRDTEYCQYCGAYLFKDGKADQDELKRSEPQKPKKEKAPGMPREAKITLAIGIAMMLSLFAYAMYDMSQTGDRHSTVEVTIQSQLASDSICSIYFDGELMHTESIVAGGTVTVSLPWDWYGGTDSTVRVEARVDNSTLSAKTTTIYDGMTSVVTLMLL